MAYLGVRRFGLPAWGWLLMVAFGLRILNLGNESLWYDETFTAWVTTRLSWSDMWAAIRGDVHPPLFYLLELVNVRLLGQSEFALRLPSALLGTLAVFMVWRLARIAGLGPRGAMLAGGLAAVMPTFLYYAQDARMYPLMTVCILGALWSAIRKQWLFYSLCCIAAVYTQNIALVYVGVLTLGAWLSSGRPRGLVVAAATIALAWLPWAPVFFAQALDVGDGFWIGPLDVGNAISPIWTMTIGRRLPDPYSWCAALGTFGFTIVALLNARRWGRSRGGVLVLAVAVGVPFSLALVSWVWHSIYLHRALLPAAHALCIVWAYALTNLSPGNAQVARLIMIPVILNGVFSHYISNLRDDYRSMVQPVIDNWRQGDMIFHTAIHTSITLGYYLRDYPYRLRPDASDLNQSLSAATASAMQIERQSFDDLPPGRVWLLSYVNPMSRADEYAAIAEVLRCPHETFFFRDNGLASLGIYLVEKGHGTCS